jgi:hypothetical protein
MAVPPTPAPAVVELVISGPGFSDAERFDLATDSAARAFARDVMDFALRPQHRKRRGRTGSPVAAEPKE